MNKRRRNIILALSVVGVVITLVILKVGKFGGRDIPSPEEAKLEEINKGESENLREETLEDEKVPSRPVELIKHGWRPIARTLPQAGYIWEWAVELENKTPIAVKVFIKYNLLDGEGKTVAEAYGGDEFQPYEKKIIVGKSASSELIERAEKIKVRIDVSPQRQTEDVAKIWVWGNVFQIESE